MWSGSTDLSGGQIVDQVAKPLHRQIKMGRDRILTHGVEQPQGLLHQTQSLLELLRQPPSPARDLFGESHLG